MHLKLATRVRWSSGDIVDDAALLPEARTLRQVILLPRNSVEPVQLRR